MPDKHVPLRIVSPPAGAHLYAQASPHDPAYILGDRKALESIRQAVDEALARGAGAAELSAADGADYALVCLRRDSIARTAVPYTSPRAREPVASMALRPWDIAPVLQAQAINAATAPPPLMRRFTSRRPSDSP
ncbi:MAG TPA: hypothetical protein VFQ88_07265 [Nevskiaceae bacterium]|nr:hypothetical protein [Nevskiaceae bacterium]